MDDAAPEQEILASTSPVSAANVTSSALLAPYFRGFRVIPLGNFDLLQEIRLQDASGKLYHVLEWRHELQTYSGIRQYYDMFEDLPLTQIYLRYCKYLEYKLVGVYTAWIRKLMGGLVIDVMRQGGTAVRQFVMLPLNLIHPLAVWAQSRGEGSQKWRRAVESLCTRPRLSLCGWLFTNSVMIVGAVAEVKASPIENS
ncbi:hypothetical protein B0H14DRAFT_2574939 [Mycena olivaceomarginata]|nr:hypothetical protein B0H14DRAFT_2574939 [Mycena olivaceomarginata]